MPPSTPEEGIRRTLAQYGQLCDEGRFVEFADLFALDARVRVMGETHEGRGVIHDWIVAAQPPESRGKHAMLSSVIDLDDGATTARAWTDYVFVDQRMRVTSSGRYHDELAREDDGRWRFTLREIVFMGGEPEAAPPIPG